MLYELNDMPVNNALRKVLNQSMIRKALKKPSVSEYEINQILKPETKKAKKLGMYVG